ncbi:YdcF family protein [uncultured Sphingomonas sp.]|uniref:YdcF family protein n=1 Tax=uncultured Sphingomonas sp. TaxID=158754 RepID=UPI0035CB62D0
MVRRLVAGVALAWVLGFALFMLMMPSPLENRRTDAIVVLTGGMGRIDRGLALLKAGQATRMLVSGVAPGVRPIDLAIEYRTPTALFRCCIDLGREAVDTRSNADETARWVHAHGYRSVRLVTSDWHMARARMELVYALGNEATVVADGVASQPPLGLLIDEYDKLLLRRVALWLGLGT